MKVVIAGAWNRSEKDDFGLVNKLVDQLLGVYKQQLFIITGGCDRGVGKIVKNRCFPLGEDGGRPKVQAIDWMEVNLKIYRDRPAKLEMARIWTARNAFWVEFGEEFHIFMDYPGGAGGGAMQDLLTRVQMAGLPYSTYKPGVDKEPKMLASPSHV